jgi:hypothetical protein
LARVDKKEGVIVKAGLPGRLNMQAAPKVVNVRNNTPTLEEE